MRSDKQVHDDVDSGEEHRLGTEDIANANAGAHHDVDRTADDEWANDHAAGEDEFSGRHPADGTTDDLTVTGTRVNGSAETDTRTGDMRVDDPALGGDRMNEDYRDDRMADEPTMTDSRMGEDYRDDRMADEPTMTDSRMADQAEMTGGRMDDQAVRDDMRDDTRDDRMDYQNSSGDSLTETANGTETARDTGRAPASDIPPAVELFPTEEVERFRGEWREIQVRFVDDPRDAVQNADQLVAQVMQSLATTFTNHKHELEGRWQEGDKVETEDLRQALQQYRSFFNHLLEV
jgi:hypothetical protein